MPILSADKFTRQQLDIIRGVILVCEFYAKEESEKRLLKKACFWWNQLAEFWNNKNEGEEFQFIELKEEVKEITALAIRPRLTLSTNDRKYLKSIKVRWERGEEKEEDDSA